MDFLYIINSLVEEHKMILTNEKGVELEVYLLSTHVFNLYEKRSY
jgi:hypothetical protein